MKNILKRLSILVFSFATLAPAQSAAVWTKVLAENYAAPDIVTVTVPQGGSITVRWGANGTFVSKTFTATATFPASNATFGDPIPGTAKELDLSGTDLSVLIVDGKQLAAPQPVVVSMVVAPSLITLVTGSVVLTKAVCTYSDGTTQDCTTQATYTPVSGGVTGYTGAGAILGTQAGPAVVNVVLGNVTVKLGILVVDLPIYFNGTVIQAVIAP